MYYSVERFRGLDRSGRKAILSQMHDERKANLFGTIAEKDAFLKHLRLLEDVHEEEKGYVPRKPRVEIPKAPPTSWEVLLED